MINGCLVASANMNSEDARKMHKEILAAQVNKKKFAFYGELLSGTRSEPKFIDLWAIGDEWGRCVLKLKDGKFNFGEPP